MPSESINWSLQPLLELRRAGRRPFVPIAVTNAGNIARRREYQGFYTVVLNFGAKHDFRPLHGLDVYLWIDLPDFRKWAPIIGPQILAVDPARFVMCGVDSAALGRDIYERVIGANNKEKAV